MTLCIFKVQMPIGGNGPMNQIMFYNQDRSIEGIVEADAETMAFLKLHGPKSFWLAPFKDGLVDLSKGELVEDPGW